MSAPQTSWLCTNQRCAQLPPSAARAAATTGHVLQRLLGSRLKQEKWIRYGIDVGALQRATTGPALTLMTDAIIQRLREHPWHRQPQLITALRYWQHGLRHAYIWLEDDKPLCFQWLFTQRDNARLRSLPEWAGMYPPLAPAEGQVENLLAFPAGLRYPGGAPTVFTYSMLTIARDMGLRRLRTHIHERNIAAQRWAARTGWTSCGTIRRYQLDLKLLRYRFLYLHSNEVLQRPVTAITVIRTNPDADKLSQASRHDPTQQVSKQSRVP